MGGTIQGPQVQAQRPQQMGSQVMQGAPRQRSFFETLLGAAGPIVGMFNPVAGAAIGAANGLMQGDAGAFAQGVSGAMSSSQEQPSENKQTTDVSHEAIHQGGPPRGNADTPVDAKQAQAPMQQPQMPLWMYQDPMLLLLMKYMTPPQDFQTPFNPFSQPRQPLFNLPPGYGGQQNFGG